MGLDAKRRLGVKFKCMSCGDLTDQDDNICWDCHQKFPKHICVSQYDEYFKQLGKKNGIQ